MTYFFILEASISLLKYFILLLVATPFWILNKQEGGRRIDVRVKAVIAICQ